MNSKKKTIIESIITTVFLGLMVYAAYSLWYIFYGTDSSWDVHLYTILTGSALGWFLVLLVQEVFEKANWIPKLIAFFAGNGFFQGVIWGFNSKLNESCTDNEPVIIKAYTVAFVLSAIILLVAFVLRAKKGFKALNIILLVVYFAVSCGGAVVFNIDNIKALEYKKNIQFDSISAEEMKLTDEEKKLCMDWYNEHFFGENSEYPFTFKVDGEEFNPLQWNKSIEKVSEEAVYRCGKTGNFVLTNEEKGLQVTVEATSFENSATCQWIVYIKNIGTENSGVISDFYALNSSILTGDAQLYYSIGSDTAASDFSLVKKKLSSSAFGFSGSEGKPTEKYLPYFNINGQSCSAILGIGWTGQWAAALAENDGETSITVKQESFNAYLLPGEEIRSPLVSLSFYDNSNAVKGFNLFRSWIMDSVYPEEITKNYYTVMEVAGPISTRTSDEIINILDNEIAESAYEQTDAFWMDAGWYNYNEGWHDGVGNWTVDTSRYDNGISELSSYAKNKGLGHVLWYEPERLFRDTHFYNIGSQNEGWLVDVGEDNIMWNLANEEAFDYYCKYLLNSMKENGITVYRQDFNFAPLKYWQKADAEYYDGREGICENHYVTNLYRYLDYLCENIPGLIIDNCASGGKRLDLEMTYRSIPFWRSDYNCSYHADLFEATQSHTYGISFWLPISGANLYMMDEYSARSAIMPLVLMDFYSHQHPDFNLHNEQRALMGGRYYPIEFGSFDKHKMHAMQFSTEDATEGTALIYKRENVHSKEYTITLNGLIENATYEIYDIDNPEEKKQLTGEQLMSEGYKISLPDGAKAVVLMFKTK